MARGYDELTPAYRGPIPESRKDAERLSTGRDECPECAGSGLTVRWCDDLAPFRDDLRGRSVPAYCHACAMGAWIKANHDGDTRHDTRHDTREAAGRIVDLNKFPHLQAVSFKDRPDFRDAVRADLERKGEGAGGGPGRRWKDDLAAELRVGAGRG